MTEIKWLFGFLKPYVGRVLLSILLGTLAIGANVGLMGTSGYLIAGAALHPSTILLLWVPIVGVRFFGISRSVFRYLERLASHDLTFRILARVRVWFFRNVEARPGSLLESYSSGDILARAVDDVEQLQNLYLRILAPMAVAFLVGVFGTYWTARFSASLAAVYALVFVVDGVVLPLANHRLGKKQGTLAVQARWRYEIETKRALSSASEILVYGFEGQVEGELGTLQAQLSYAQKRRNTLDAVSGGVSIFLTNLAVWSGFMLLAPIVTAGRMPGPQLASVLLIILASFEAVQPLPAAFREWSETRAVAKRLRDFVQPDVAQGSDVQPTLPDTDTSGAHSDLTQNGPGEVPALSEVPDVPNSPLLEVRNLCAGYSPLAPDTIRDIDLVLRKGDKVAIVGESGAGKSTLVQTLLGLIPASDGEIFLDGTSVDKLTQEQVRNYFAVVSQDAYLFHVSVRDNLRMAKPTATDEELEAAVETARLLDFIRHLPDGFDTIVGEDGSRFSGGERQRLALARALLHHAPILILDEPTNGLDAQTEREFYDALWRACKDRAVLQITHRITGLENMTEILVMSQGRIVDSGTHETLKSKPGSLYRRLWELELLHLPEL